jgi:hypothetical protein
MKNLFDHDKELEMWQQIHDFVSHRDMPGLMSLCTYYHAKYGNFSPQLKDDGIDHVIL